MYFITTKNNASISFGPCPSTTLPLNESIIAYKESGVDLIVSLLQEHEELELNLDDEERICTSLGISFLHFPIIDMSIPSLARFTETVEYLYQCTTNKKGIYIHCLHGIGRSSLVTAGLLVRSGMLLKDVMKLIAEKRGLKVPETLSQIKLLGVYEKALMRTDKRKE